MNSFNGRLNGGPCQWTIGRCLFKRVGMYYVQQNVQGKGYRNIMLLIKDYGRNVKAKLKGGSNDKLFTVTINTENCSRKVFHQRRCGKNLLSKRKFVMNANGRFVYSGCCKIVVIGITPITISYYTKTSLSFCTWRYDDQDFVLDAHASRD